MKKLILCMAVCCTLMLQAATYSYLVFTNTAGTVTVLPVDGLQMTVSGSELVVTQSDSNVRFALTELATMQFSNDPMAIDQILEADQPVQVFSLTGTLLGTFPSLLEAAGQLSAGAYVVSNGSVTQKIVVK